MKKELYLSVNNYRQFKVKFLVPTNYRGARVKIYEPARYNEDKTDSITLPYCYEIDKPIEQACQFLIKNGLKVVARASERDNYILLVDSWGEGFKKLSDLNQ